VGVKLSVRRAGRAGVAVLTLASTIALGGCWWHDSLVPAVAEADRATRSPLRAGVYCSLEAEAEGLALSDECARLEWDRESRQIRVTEIQEDGESGDEVWVDVAPIGRGLSIMQNSVLAADGQPPKYELFAVYFRREGYALIPLPSPAVRDAIAAEEGVTVEPAEGADDYGTVTAGEPAAVRRMVERSAFAWLDARGGSRADRFAAYDADRDDQDRAPAYSIRLEALGGDRDADALDRAAERLRRGLAGKAED
jgi:hypothetical protein